MARQTTVKTLPRIVGVAGGGETKKGELKENTGAKTRKTKVKTLPQATIVAGGARQKAKTNTKLKGGTAHSPARGGCLAENAYQKRKQNNVHHKEGRKNIQSCATV